MSLSPYLLNVALHAVVLSAASVLIIAFLRKPRAKAAVALGCLMGSGGTLSWISPLRPAEKTSLSIPITTPRLVELAPAAPPPPVEAAVLPVTEYGTPPSEAGNARLQPAELVAALWAAGVLVGLLGIARSLWQGSQWQRSLSHPNDDEWAALRNALPRELNRNAFRVAEGKVSPCVTGFLAPGVVIPRSLLDGSKPSELAWAMRHESTHFDGQDSRWAVAVGLVRTIFWWNPLVHWIARMWSDAREKACDQAAAMTDCERADYGEFLVVMAAGLTRRPTRGPAMARHGKAKRLKRRVTSLLTAAPGMPARVSKLQAAGCGIAFAATLGATSLLAFAKEAPEAEGADGNLTLERILNPSPQLGVSMALLKTTQPFCTQGQLFSAEELELKLKAASSGRAIQLLPLSSTIEEFGAASWAHLTSADEAGSGLTEPPWDGKTTKTPFVGWVVGRNSHLAGENVTVSIEAAYAFAPGYHLAPGFGMTGLLSRGSVRQVTFEAKAEVPSGKAVGFAFGEVEPGVHVSIILGLTVARPWELPGTWEPGPFPSLSPKQPQPIPVNFEPVSVVNDDPEYQRTLKQYSAAHKAWLDALNALPANREFVRQRDLLLQRFKEEPGDRETNWKLQRLGEAILANAEKDIDVRILKQETEKLSSSHFSVTSRISNKNDEDRRQRHENQQRREMEQFERRRHEW